jgi:ABC-type multidrug transport system ATPase subunit
VNNTEVYGQQLTKSYGEHQALNGLYFEINRGEIFGFIGPDGAGKTSLFRILTTLLLPDSGVANVAGLDVVKQYRQLRLILGYMPQKFSLYTDLTVRENLDFFAGIFKVKVKENLYLVDQIYGQLQPFESRRAGDLSGGMKQKLALSCALIHKPRVLILDEPTTGVDAVSRQEFWEMLLLLKKEGITILVSTPYMDEARLCDRIALMQHGIIMATGSPVEIISGFSKNLFRLKPDNTLTALHQLRQMSGIHRAEMFGAYIHLSTSSEIKTPAAVAQKLQSGNIHYTMLEAIEPGIEDCFIELMQQTSEP